MIVRVGHIPYLNMVPFHNGFGPDPLERDGRRIEFWNRSPRALGEEAEKGVLDAGALSLVDALRLSDQFEPVANFGIGVHGPARSVLLFSRSEMPSLAGCTIAVTDETSTSFRLLQLLLEARYKLQRVRYGRIASVTLYDGSADAVLLIGDEALRARQEGIKGLPVITDLGDEWFAWHQTPFVFARWMVRSERREDVKNLIEAGVENALARTESDWDSLAMAEATRRGQSAQDVRTYWSGFAYRLQPEHFESIRRFEALLEKQWTPA